MSVNDSQVTVFKSILLHFVSDIAEYMFSLMQRCNVETLATHKMLLKAK